MAHRFMVDFDEDAQVWFVRDSSLPGLRTEALSLDALVAKLKVMVPDLLAAIAETGGAAEPGEDIPIEVILHTNTRALRPAA